MRLSIGGLSKTFGLSDEALRYYERKGLLKPEREGTQDRRIYDKGDIQRICNIKRMVALGFSLAQIKQAYQGVAENSLAALYKNKRKTIRKDILYQIRVYEHLKLVTQALNKKDEMLFTPYQVQLEKAYARVFSSTTEMWEAVTLEKALQAAILHQPLVSFCTFIDAKNGLLDSPEIKKGLVTFASDAAVLPISVRDYQTIQIDEAVECLFRLENGEFDFTKIFNPIQSYLDREKLIISDLIFTHKLFDYKDQDGNIIHYARLIVPVRPADEN